MSKIPLSKETELAQDAASTSSSGNTIGANLANLVGHETPENLFHLGIQRFKTLADATFEGIVIVDEGRIVECNDQLAAILGYSMEELVGSKVESFVIPEERNRVVATVTQHLDAHLETKAVRKDGTVITVESRGRAMAYKGRIVRLAAVRDVTEKVKATEAVQLQQSELAHLSRLHTMGQVVFGLAHELNQPLSSILNYAVGLQETVGIHGGRIEQYIPALQVIQSEAERAGGIIRRLRSFARKQSPMRSSVDLKALVAEAMYLMDLQLRHAGIKTRVESSDPAPRAMTDSAQILQVLINLIRNAVDAMTNDDATGKTLTIKLSLQGDVARVEVSDQGCGVPNGLRHRLFEPFFTTKPDGMGMGLSICQTIVSDLGGQLTAEPNPTGGMNFIFTCPTG